RSYSSRTVLCAVVIGLLRWAWDCLLVFDEERLGGLGRHLGLLEHNVAHVVTLRSVDEHFCVRRGNLASWHHVEHTPEGVVHDFCEFGVGSIKVPEEDRVVLWGHASVGEGLERAKCGVVRDSEPYLRVGE